MVARKNNVKNVNVENAKENEAMKNENVVTVEAKENVNVEAKENEVMTINETVETVETVIPSVEELRNEILGKIKEEKARYNVWYAVNEKGYSINATNWGKDDTRTGKDTLGSYIRYQLDNSKNIINGLKRDLKETYFGLLPELKALQNSDNRIIVDLVNECIENMRNVPVIKNQYTFSAGIVKLLASAKIKNVGVTPDNLGVLLPVLITNGYVYDMTCPQPTTIEEIRIDGLDYIPACTYYNFVLAE